MLSSKIRTIVVSLDLGVVFTFRPLGYLGADRPFSPDSHLLDARHHRGSAVLVEELDHPVLGDGGTCHQRGDLSSHNLRQTIVGQDHLQDILPHLASFGDLDEGDVEPLGNGVVGEEMRAGLGST